MGPFSLLGSRLDSGACCQPAVHDRKPRLGHDGQCYQNDGMVDFRCTHSSLSTSSLGNDAEWSITGKERSRTM